MINLLTIWPHRELPGWDGDEARLETLPAMRSAVPVPEALAAAYDTDAHAWPGIVRFEGEAQPQIPRINLPALPVIVARGGAVLFGSIWVDVDDPVAHDQKLPEARDVWRAMMDDVIGRLPEELRDGLAWYDTRGGIRLVWALDREVPPDVFLELGRRFRARLRSLGFDRLDELKDWGRCYRLPYVVRDGHRQDRRADLGSFGDRPLVVDQVLAQDLSAASGSPFGRIASAKTPFALPPVVPAGQRNQTLTRLAGSLRRSGLEEPAILAALRAEVEGGRCGDWRPDRGELEQIARSVARYAPGPAPEEAPSSPAPFQARVMVQPPAPTPDAPPPPPIAVALDRPTIKVRVGELLRVVGEFEAALQPAEIYQRGGKIVATGRDPSAGSKLRIRTLDKTALRLAALCVADWRTWKASRAQPKGNALDPDDGPAGEWVPSDPPMQVMELLAAKGEWSFPPLVGVSELPLVRADGSIWTTPGYDQATGYLYDPGALKVPPIPEAPTKDDARAALAQLVELIDEFPFGSRVDRSVALASFLTCVCRSAMSRAPLTITDGHTPASGKSLIAQIGAILATGDEIPVLSETADEELEKRITAMLRAGDSVILIDNVTRPVGGSSLDALLTASHWKGRVLGGSEMVELPNVATWYVSGNNVVIRGDLTRRALRCFLDVPVERPELRTGFRISDLPGHVRQHRGRLVAVALTVIRARALDLEAPRPPALGSFRDWSYLVRDALVWLGEADPVSSQEALRAVSDLGLAAFSELLGAWRSFFADQPVQITEALEILDRKAHDENARRVIRAIEELAELPLTDRKTAARLGYAIRSRAGRTVDGLMFVQRGEARMGRRWCVDRATAGQVRR